MSDDAKGMAVIGALVVAGLLYVAGWHWPLDRLQRWVNSEAKR